MAKAKKLPSGNWRCRAYAYTDAAGKAHYESFTASTRQEAELLAAKYKADNNRRARNDMTVSEAIDGYITAKTGVLSPATIRGYRNIQKNRFNGIGHLRVRRLSSEDAQRWVSDMAQTYSPKSVKGAYGLLTAALAMCVPDKTLRVTLPQNVKERQTAPHDEAVAALFNAAKGNLRKAIALAAFGSLRRGEICAVTYGDLKDGVLSVVGDMVMDEHGKWVIKAMPKTSDSVRDVRLPDEVVELLGTGFAKERIVPIYPATITREFIALRNKLDLPEIRFHDLRHYFASIAVALNIPDTYLSAFGGWRQGSAVLKTVYQNQITPIAEGYSRKLTDHFSSIINK